MPALARAPPRHDSVLARGRNPAPGRALHLASLSVRIPVLRVSEARDALKFRGWLLAVLFVHVVLHPWVHAMGVASPAGSTASVSNRSAGPDGSVSAVDHCELCRVGHSATATPRLPRTDLLNPRWIHTALTSVNYASLLADSRRPSRAPPVL